jgi:hypothetical protein
VSLAKRRKQRQSIDAGGPGRQDNIDRACERGEAFDSLLVAEWCVPTLIAILLVVFVVLSLLLAAWTLFFQGYIYSEPVEAIYWRAPAAGGALTLFVIIWVVCDYRSIEDRRKEGVYHPLHEFSFSETKTYKYLWVPSDGREERYTLQGNQYVSKSGRRLPGRPIRVTAGDDPPDDEKHVFEPEMDNGHFKAKEGETLRYYEQGNKARYMDENMLGRISITHYGWLVGTLLLNFGFFLVWFVVLWLLLRFQWSHALGIAFGFWLVSLFVLPMILTRAEQVRKERLTAQQAAMRMPSLLPQSSAGPS